MDDYRQISYWFDSLEDSGAKVSRLPDSVDIAIIGGGFTGLWTAYYLKSKSPDLRVGIFEAETVGFGASGRNGGWCMGTANGMERLLYPEETRQEGIRLQHSLHGTVDEIGRVCQAENIDCHFARGGTLNVAGTPEVARRHQDWVKFMHGIGFAEDEYRWLDADESMRRIRLSRNHGAFFTAHCASIHPARLVRGLADVARRMGVEIIEKCPVFAYQTGSLRTGRGTVTAEKIIRATEGYTDSIQHQRRQLLPLYSMVIATEPMSNDRWQEIGLANRETFDDGRRVVIYGQRTLDNRLVFGGRAGYYFGSKRKSVIDSDDVAVRIVERQARELVPALAGVEITHGWGGLMGVPRHWRPCVSYDEKSRTGWAGGYTGEGVGASNLAGRMMSDLALGEKSDLTTLSWVNDVPRRWEPEPVRWLGVKAIEFFGDRADRAEARGATSGFWGSLFNRFVG
jgi:glycine/D-amino acid oxidase-like deaminating enzyme